MGSCVKIDVCIYHYKLLRVDLLETAAFNRQGCTVLSLVITQCFNTESCVASFRLLHRQRQISLAILFSLVFASGSYRDVYL